MRRIMVIEDDASLRGLLAEHLREHGFAVQEFHGAQEALQLAEADPPDLILLDLLMPRMSGHEFLDIARGHPRLSAVPVVVLSSDASLPQVAASYPVRACLAKPVDLDVLGGVVHAVLGVEADDGSGGGDQPAQLLLTARELEIARLVAGGLTNRQIADALVLTSGTVANHIERIRHKLHANSRVDVAVWVVQRGLLRQ